MALKHVSRRVFRLTLICFFVFSCARVWGATGGSISGTVTDQTGGVIPGAKLTLVNLDLATSYKVTADAQGFYSFPTLPVGRYELTIEATGFKTQKKTGLTVDADAAIRVDAKLEVGNKTETVTVTASAAQARVKLFALRSNRRGSSRIGCVTVS